MAADSPAPSPDTEAYFTSYVRPILESACTHCHNADSAKGDLRLDTLEACLKGGSATALVPGKPEASPLYTSTVLAADHDDIMPPSKEPPLTKSQTEILKAWITAGAKWPAGLVLGVVPRIQFVRDIQPIFEQNCLSCHGAEKPKGGLVMSTLADCEKGGDSGTSLVSFDAGKSTIYTRTILPDDDDELMPPKKKGGPLAKPEIEKLQLWINQGAAWPEGVVLVQKAKTEDRLPSPDTLDLTTKIHAFITEKSSHVTSTDGYESIIPKIGKAYKMVAIPGGEFTLGSPGTEIAHQPDESPQVKVKIEPFWMAEAEVTWDMFLPFMLTTEARWKDGAKKDVPKPTDTPVDAVSSPTTPYTDMTFGMGQDGYPALSMTQHSANKFCQWLSAQTGHFYRLPTEAEWEYAARAGTTTTWFWGDDVAQLDDYAWWDQNSDAKSQLVKQKKPNPWGLYDIIGNVAEWTLDQYSEGYYATLSAGVVSPLNMPTTIYPRAARGGSWFDGYDDKTKGVTYKYLRAASRRGSKEQWKVQDPQRPRSIWYLTDAQFLGFRMVRPVKVPTAAEMHTYWNVGNVGQE